MYERTNTALAMIAYGAEEMEAVIVVDILRRAGVSVVVAGESQIITCSRGVKLIPDVLLDDVLEEELFDAVVLPGGSRGVENLGANPHVERLVRANYERGALLCAICAAPVLLEQFGILAENPGIRITSHPSAEAILRQTGRAEYTEEAVVAHNGVVTSRGAGTAFEFALTVVEMLEGGDVAARIAREILLPQPAAPQPHSADVHQSAGEG